MIRLTAQPFITQKKEEDRVNCQDAWCQDEKVGRYAVADGATRSFFPKEWAELLVEHFCEAPNPIPNTRNWKAWLKPIQDKWHKRVVDKVKARPLFYLVNSLNSKEPATSTFIGLEFDKVQGRWQAMIVGDSCLFKIGTHGFDSYIIEKSSDFTNCPGLFASFEKDNHCEPTCISGDANPGDTFILATDALAKWILEHNEAGRRDDMHRKLNQINNEIQFHEFVDCARKNKDIPLNNDDVTLMMIAVQSAEQAKVEDDQPASHVASGMELETHPPSDPLRLLFWVLVVGMIGFIVGGLICYLIFLFIKD